MGDTARQIYRSGSRICRKRSDFAGDVAHAIRIHDLIESSNHERRIPIRSSLSRSSHLSLRVTILARFMLLLMYVRSYLLYKGATIVPETVWLHGQAVSTLNQTRPATNLIAGVADRCVPGLRRIAAYPRTIARKGRGVVFVRIEVA